MNTRTIIIAVTAAITLAGCGGAAASTAPALSQASSRPAVTAMSTWCAGPGPSDLQAVVSDLTPVEADLGDGDYAAVTNDGQQLTSDAEAAEKLPPPVTRAQQVNYVLAMGAVSFAGTDLTAGNYQAATDAIGTANSYLSKDKGVLPC